MSSEVDILYKVMKIRRGYLADSKGQILSNPNDVSPAASNLFFGFFSRGGP